MADSSKISEYLYKIETAIRGEDVRDGIIDALEQMSKDNNNARTLGGHPPGYFAKQADFNLLMPLDNEPTEFSTKPLSSGGMYNYLVTEIGENCLDDKISGESGGDTIAEKLAYIAETKRQIRTALHNKGQIFNDNETPFREYANKVAAIETHQNYDITTLEATENKEYTAPQNVAYNVVNVDVKPNLTTKNIDKNGTFKAKDDDADGYSEVTVDVSKNLMVKNITSEDLEGKEPNAIHFKPSTEPDYDEHKDRLGYSEINIDLTGKFQELPIEVDPNNYAEETTYDASTEGLYGYSKVVVRVKESAGPFTVEFWNDTSKLLTVDNVPLNGVARYTGNLPEKEGAVFSGWNPEPINVTRNLKCYAQFIKESDVSTPSWKNIAQNGGADIPVGKTLKLIVGPFDYDGMHIKGINIKMKKIAKNRDGCTSIWCSVDPLPSLGDGYRFFALNEISIGKVYIGWEDSPIRKFLNDVFYAALKMSTDKKYGYSGCVADAIRPIDKVTCGVSVEAGTDIDLDGQGWYSTMRSETADKIWIPSMAEIGEENDDEDGTIAYDFQGISIPVTRSIVNMERIRVDNNPSSEWEEPYAGRCVELRADVYGGDGRPTSGNTACYAWVNGGYRSAYKNAHSGEDIFPGDGGIFDDTTNTYSWQMMNIHICFGT